MKVTFRRTRGQSNASLQLSSCFAPLFVPLQSPPKLASCHGLTRCDPCRVAKPAENLLVVGIVSGFLCGTEHNAATECVSSFTRGVRIGKRTDLCYGGRVWWGRV